MLPRYNLHQAAVKEVQLIEAEQEVLEDIGRDPEAKVMEDLIHYEPDEPSLDRFFLMGDNLEERERTEIIQLLKTNIEVFAWTSYKMPGIDPTFIKHKLNVLLEAHPMKQQGRRSAAEHVDAMIQEVEKLKETSAIAEVLYPS